MGKRNNEEHSGILHSSADVVGIIKSKSAECTEYSTCERDAALVEGYRQGKTEAPGETRIPLALSAPQIPGGLLLDQIWACVVRGRRLTALGLFVCFL
jgi:hypothetical protein